MKFRIHDFKNFVLRQANNDNKPSLTRDELLRLTKDLIETNKATVDFLGDIKEYLVSIRNDPKQLESFDRILLIIGKTHGLLNNLHDSQLINKINRL